MDPLVRSCRNASPCSPPVGGFFGFTFIRNQTLLITELFGTATSIPAGGRGAVSAYGINKDGSLNPIVQDVGDGGTAACWIALEPIAGQYAYVSNNLSANISSYAVGTRVTLVAAVAAATSGPNDLATAVEGGNSFLYSVNAGNGTVGAYQINLTNGSLTALGTASGLPAAAAQGIAAF